MCPGEETIAAYVSGGLERAERDDVDSHLDTCSVCQELVAALLKLRTGPDAQATTREAAPASTWEPGGHLGRYLLLAHLGAGGMGVVYAAYDPELDRKVALKVLRRTRAGEQLRDEAKAIAKLAHPNVIAVHDVGEADGEVFIAMEHVDGVTVREWLRTRRTRDEILHVFVQAGRGLAAAHEAGLVHRDVKPSNIIVGADGRARVLDFGLARGGDDDQGIVVGTPAYMAPEQKRGERVDARADQYAFCLALWESLGGGPGTDRLDGVPERITRALRRGLAADPAARFPTMTALVDAISPPPPRVRRWIVATGVAAVALIASVGYTVTRPTAAPSCATAAAPIAAVWNDSERAAVHAAFAATRLPYAATSADATIAQLDDWTSRWRSRAQATCRATVIERVQPAQMHALRQTCLAQLAERLSAVVATARAADANVVATARMLVSTLPSPERCDDVTALTALPPLPPSEHARDAIASLRSEITTKETALIAGRVTEVQREIDELRTRIDATDYLPLRARGELLLARMHSAAGDYAASKTALHGAAHAAIAARDLDVLADVWIELVQVLGNDQRTLDEAAVFDRYAVALAAQLSDRELRELQLEMARCNRQGGRAEAIAIAATCQTVIERALRISPPRKDLAIAARTRLGHFLRLQGKHDEALAMLRENLAEAIAVHGPAHPDVGIAHFALGMALLTIERHDEAITELRTSLTVRRAAFPAGGLQVAESLQGLADALSSSGNNAEAITLLEEAVQTLEAANQSDSAQAANVHILLGMSLQELGDPAGLVRALVHFVRAADIADRSLQHREPLAAMALRLAASIEAATGHAASGVPHLERAVRLLERAKAPPGDVALTQLRLAELLSQLGPRERARARAELATARAGFTAAGDRASLAEVDALAKRLR